MKPVFYARRRSCRWRSPPRQEPARSVGKQYHLAESSVSIAARAWPVSRQELLYSAHNVAKRQRQDKSTVPTAGRLCQERTNKGRDGSKAGLILGLLSATSTPAQTRRQIRPGVLRLHHMAGRSAINACSATGSETNF